MKIINLSQVYIIKSDEYKNIKHNNIHKSKEKANKKSSNLKDKTT